MMELYTISSIDNRRETIIEEFESFVWTDRYSSYGDFEIKANPSKDMVSRLTPGKLVGFDSSDRIMKIDTVLHEEDSEGKQTLTIKGRSLEWQLQKRIAKKVWADVPWDLSGTPGSIITQMVNTVCVLGTGVSALDVIPGLTASNYSTIATVYTLSIKSGALYDRIKDICDSFELGFRIRKPDLGTSALRFEVYSGTNRTGMTGVAFSKDSESLSQTSRFSSQESFKNVAYVVTKTTGLSVTASGYSGVTGLDRNVLLVDASDLTVTGAALTAAMTQRGRDALAANAKIELFDGSINPASSFKYGTHYFLGDLIVLVGDNEERQTMRITENIWSGDESGITSYPTFSAIGGV